MILLVKCVATQTISSLAFPALFETGESSKFQSVVDSIRHDVINFIFEMEVAALYEMLAVTPLSAQRGVCRFSFWRDNNNSILQFETPIVVLALRSREHFSDFSEHITALSQTYFLLSLLS